MTSRPLCRTVVEHKPWQKSVCYTAGAYTADILAIKWFLKKNPNLQRQFSKNQSKTAAKRLINQTVEKMAQTENIRYL